MVKLFKREAAIWDPVPEDRMWRDQEDLELYASIGWSLTQWAAVEGQLAAIFAYVVYGRQPEENYNPAPHNVLATIHSVSSKLTAIDVVCRTALTGKDYKIWSSLSNKVGKQSSNRNALAHWQAIPLGLKNGRQGPLVFLNRPRPDAPDPELKPPRNRRPNPFVRAPQIIEWGSKFHALAAELALFRPFGMHT
jgi:hypothetical protein